MLHKHFTPFPTLTTERLMLRQLVIADEREIFSLRSDSEINKYLDRQPCNTIADARNFITTVNENIHKNDALYWAITLSDSDKLVGTICLFGFSDENNTCEIGYELSTDFQGQGIMKEAAQKVIDYAFKNIQIEKIEAVTHRDNQHSIKLLDKLSFSNANQPGNTDPEVVCFHLTNSL